MKDNISVKFTVWTFLIMVLGWGICVVYGQFDITLNNHFWLYIPFFLGGWSPTIASYIVLKKSNQVTGFKEWLKNIFSVKQPVWLYALVIFLCAVYFVPQILISGTEKIYPMYRLILFAPLMLFSGGLEEAGWRYILQPELDKRIGFISSSLVVGVIWAIWHLPLFFIPRTAQYGDSFGLFAINVFALTFALGAIRKVSGSVFLCVLFHCLINAGWSSVFIIKHSLWGSSIMSVLLIGASIAAVILAERKTAKRIHAEV